jgi:RNA polymerase sigma-70 factor (ECF subfamily)
MSDPTEIQLVRDSQNGDREAFMELVRSHREKIYNLALGMTQNAADADTLSQDAFVKAFENIQRFEGHSSFFTWVYRITVNHCLNFLKKRGREVPLPAPSFDGERGAPEIGRIEPPDGPLQEQETQRQVRLALSNLRADLRVTVVLVYLEDKTPREAAAVLGCAEATVHWRLFRARKLLKKLFTEQGLCL